MIYQPTVLLHGNGIFRGQCQILTTLQNPTGIYYAASGTFPVTLVACNTTGCDSVTYTTFINEFPTPVQPTVNVNGNTLCANGYVAYQWFEISNPTVVLSTDSCFTPVIAGNYFVLSTDNNGCESASAALAITTELIELINTDLISVNPNPFNQFINLEFNLTETKNVSISIVDITGRIVKNILSKNLQPRKNNITIDLIELNSGLYFCKIKTDENFQTIKLIKN